MSCELYVFLCMTYRKLLLFVIPLIFMLLAMSSHARTDPFIGFLFFVVFTVLVINFPNVVPALQKRPLYLENIEVGTNEDSITRVFFLRTYYIFVNVGVSVIATAVVHYAYFQIQTGPPDSYIALVGIIGGVMSFGGRVINTWTRIMLVICNYAQENMTDNNLLPVSASIVTEWPYVVRDGARMNAINTV